MSEEVQGSEGSPQGVESPALEGKGENVALRQARQKEYRARQREAAGLLSRLWRLRRARERGGVPGLALVPGWEELCVLLRQLVHEETLLQSVPVARQGPSELAATGRIPKAGQGRSRAGRAPKGAPAGGALGAGPLAAKPPGLSTDHIRTEGSDTPEGLPSVSVPEGKKGSTTQKAPRSKKKNGKHN